MSPITLLSNITLPAITNGIFPINLRNLSSWQATQDPQLRRKHNRIPRKEDPKAASGKSPVSHLLTKSKDRERSVSPERMADPESLTSATQEG